MRRDMIIGGQPRPAVGGARFEVLAPESGRVLAEVARAGPEDVDAAVAAARAGAAVWAGLAPARREQVLLAAADTVASEGEGRFLDNLIDESGSAITKARFEISYTVDLLRAAAGEARRLYGDTFPNDNPQRLSMVLREPMGVVAVLSPGNAPLSLLTKMAAFPLAAGNGIVIKPSEETPLTALALAEVLLEAGLPGQAISVVTGYGSECGAALAAHPGIDCLAFTGSTATGVAVGVECARHVRPCQLELGGKSALLVLRDADPVAAAAVAAQGIFTHGGQICMANSRIVVERPIFEPFAAALKAAAEAVHLGDLRDERTQYGPLINQRAVDKVMGHIQAACQGGGVLLTGGAVRGHSGGDGPGGDPGGGSLVVEPTVVVEPPRDSTLWREESFGPVAALVAVDSLDEAIAAANDSDYGLSAAVLTSNVAWGMRAAREIRSGSVHIGMHAFQSNALAPIGGYKRSGIGRSGGKYSTAEFTRVKWVSLSLEDG